jgi:hypothetical protein
LERSLRGLIDNRPAQGIELLLDALKVQLPSCSSQLGYTLFLADNPEITSKNIKLVYFSGDQVKHSS